MKTPLPSRPEQKQKQKHVPVSASNPNPKRRKKSDEEIAHIKAVKRAQEQRRKSFHDTPALSVLHTNAGIEGMTIPIMMTPSANRQFGAAFSKKSGRAFIYKRASFRKLQDFIREQVLAAITTHGWTTSHADWYILVLDFPYHDIIKQDLDGPSKPMIDCLNQQYPTRTQRKEMLYWWPAIADWMMKRPGAIMDDSQVLQILLNKHAYAQGISEDEQKAYVTIYKITPASPWYGHHVALDILLYLKLMSDSPSCPTCLFNAIE